LNLCFALFATVNAFKREHVHFLKNVAGFDDEQVNMFLKNDRGGEVMDTLIDLNKKATTKSTTTSSETDFGGGGTEFIHVQDDSTLSYDTEYSITLPIGNSVYTFINQELPSGYDYTLTFSSDSFWVGGGFGNPEEAGVIGTSLLTDCQVEFHAERNAAVLLLFTNTEYAADSVEPPVTFTLSRVASTCSYASLEAPSSGASTFSIEPTNGIRWYEIETTFATGKHIEITFPDGLVLHFLDLSMEDYELTLSFDAVTNPFVIRFGIDDSSMYSSSSVVPWTLTINTTEYTCHDGTTDAEHSFCTEAGNMHYIGDPGNIAFEPFYILVLALLPVECHIFLTEQICLSDYAPCEPTTNMAIPICQDGYCEPLLQCVELIDDGSDATIQSHFEMCVAGESNFLGELGSGAQITTMPLFTADCDASSVIVNTFSSFINKGSKSASVQQMTVVTMSLVLAGYLV